MSIRSLGQVAFALTLAIILISSAALREWFGETGVTLATALAGFIDTHAAAISAASLVATGKLGAVDATIPILAGLSTNTVSKVVFAVASGGRSFALRVIPGLINCGVAGMRWRFISNQGLRYGSNSVNSFFHTPAHLHPLCCFRVA